MSYFLAHNETDVFHYGELLEGQVIETGQPHLEYFNTLQELKGRLAFFNVEYVENIDADLPGEPENDIIA
jgi:hypothetical protein